MKKVLAILLVFAGLVLAQPADDFYGAGYWTRSFFAHVGFDFGYTNGDLNEKAISLKDTNGKDMKIYPPDIALVRTPELAVGVNIRFFTLAVSFQYASESDNLTGYEDNEKTDVTSWRLGFEFLYNLFWEGDFQIGIGGGYSYSSIKADNSALLGNTSYRSEFIGSGIGAILNAHYYFTDHIAIVPALKFYENWYKNLYTKPSGNCDLEHYVWQTYIQGSLSIQYKF